MARNMWLVLFYFIQNLFFVVYTNQSNSAVGYNEGGNPSISVSAGTDFSSSGSRFKTWPKVYNLTLGIVVSDRTIIQDFLIPFFEEINNEPPYANRPTVVLKPVYDQPDLPTKAANPIEAVLKICER